MLCFAHSVKNRSEKSETPVPVVSAVVINDRVTGARALPARRKKSAIDRAGSRGIKGARTKSAMEFACDASALGGSVFDRTRRDKCIFFFFFLYIQL